MKINIKIVVGLSLLLVIAGILIIPRIVAKKAESQIAMKIKEIGKVEKYGEITCSPSFSPSCSITDVTIIETAIDQFGNETNNLFTIEEISVSNIKDYLYLKEGWLVKKNTSLNTNIALKNIFLNNERLTWNTKIESILANKNVDQSFINSQLKPRFDVPLDVNISINISNNNNVVDEIVSISINQESFSLSFGLDATYETMDSITSISDVNNFTIKSFTIDLGTEREVISKLSYEYNKLKFPNSKLEYKDFKVGFREIITNSLSTFNLTPKTQLGLKSSLISLIMGDSEKASIKFINTNNLTLKELIAKHQLSLFLGNFESIESDLNISFSN